MFRDLRLAFRSLTKAPGFTAVAVASLGLGIGTVTTIYTWTDRFIVNPLPLVTDANRLTYLQTRARGGHGTWSLAYLTAKDWAERTHALDGLAVHEMEQVGVRIDGGVERAFGMLASDNFFDVLGVHALHGRTFQRGEESARAPVAVLGYSYWERRFNSDPSIIGRRLVINGQGFDVVGVLPPKFGGSYVGLNLDLYLPITWHPIMSGRDALANRGWQFLDGVGRLKDGVTWSDARRDLERVGADLDRLYPDEANHAVLQRIQDQGPPSTMRPVFIALLAVSGLILLIASANVANLLLARAAGRAREIGVRLAIGATRGQVVRQLLVESGILAALGGAVGLLLAQWGRDAIMLAVPPVPFPIGMEFSVNWRVATLGVVLAALTVLGFGVGPALTASRPDLLTVLRGLPTGDRRRASARTWLVAAQMALAVVSLASAGLFLRVIERSRHLDAGFRDPASLLLFDTQLRIGGYTDTTGPAVIDRLLERIRMVPGVRHASIATFVPLGWSCCSSGAAEIAGYTPGPHEEMSLVYSLVSEDYFETMGLAVASGRAFTITDQVGAPRVAVVNEAFAHRYWPGKDPIGRSLRQAGGEWTVVGVVRDGKYRQLNEGPFPLIYRPLRQSYRSEFTLHLRADGSTPALIEALRKTLATINPDLPLLDPRTMTDHMTQSLVGQQIGSRTLAVFGVLALILAAVGIYGVMSYLVGQRTREIGVRVALGAAGGAIGRMILRQGLTVTAAGAVVGLVLALAMGYAMRGLLLGLSPADPLVYLAVVTILGSVAALALVVPARRAVNVDPIVALRAD